MFLWFLVSQYKTGKQQYRAVFTWLSKGIGFGFGFGFTTPFCWLVYLLWFWFYDSQVKTALKQFTQSYILSGKTWTRTNRKISKRRDWKLENVPLLSWEEMSNSFFDSIDLIFHWLVVKVDTREGFCSRSMPQGHAPGAKLLRVYQRFLRYTSSSGAEFLPRKILHDI